VSDASLTMLWSLTTALFIPGGMIGSLLGGWLADVIGRYYYIVTSILRQSCRVARLARPYLSVCLFYRHRGWHRGLNSRRDRKLPFSDRQCVFLTQKLFVQSFNLVPEFSEKCKCLAPSSAYFGPKFFVNKFFRQFFDSPKFNVGNCLPLFLATTPLVCFVRDFDYRTKQK